ncbi:dTDP-glucose 4,6-dehydratase [Candidatus Woesearchaeota archaeon]|nr:dTDP-glucose 4,6-dehydratase [Candidatus Woesearchaeota archaeon]
MKFLVTGGAGFIGSNFIKYILNEYPGCKVINLDKLTYAGNLDNLIGISKNKNYKFVKGDICDPVIVNRLIKDVDVVVHFAAETHVDRSISDAGTFIKTDVFGTFILLNSAKNSNIKKFIHISTDEVYGSIEDGSADEDSPLKPTNPYSASKAGADRLAYSYFQTFRVPVIITRSSNNFGPHQHVEKLIPLFTTNAIENKKLPLYGDGLNKRDWLYVIDNCEAIDFLINKGVEGQVYNIGANNEKTNMHISHTVLKELGKPDSLIEFVKDRASHDRRYALNWEKIRKLGWRPKHDFDTALKQTIKWYSENRWWWSKVKKGKFKDYYQKQYVKRWQGIS